MKQPDFYLNVLKNKMTTIKAKILKKLFNIDPLQGKDETAKLKDNANDLDTKHVYLVTNGLEIES